MNFHRIVVTIFLVFLTGCAATVKRNSADAALSEIPKRDIAKLVLNVSGPSEITRSADWEGFKQEWKDNFLEQAEAAHVAFEMQDGPSRATGEDGVLLNVFVQDYRFIRPGTRYAVGVMGGNAYIKSKLTYSDLRTGESFGSQAADTSSSAWQGIFSAMTNKQVEAIATDVFKQMQSGKN